MGFLLDVAIGVAAFALVSLDSRLWYVAGGSVFVGLVLAAMTWPEGKRPDDSWLNPWS